MATQHKRTADAAGDKRKELMETDELERRAQQSRRRPDERSRGAPSQGAGDSGGETNFAGTPGGGSAVGGLGGTNVGDGSVDDVDLDEAAGTGEFDTELERQEAAAYGGRTGGAIGGTPAGKRSRGGRTGGGISPRSVSNDSTVGTNRPRGSKKRSQS